MTMPAQTHYDSPYLKTEFSNIPVYTFPMKVKDVVSISYVAVRGVDEEKGAVQRVLSKRRISEIKDFILAGNMFFNTFILNWTDQTYVPEFIDGTIRIPISHGSAQMIDGQHRVVGLQAAMETQHDIGDKQILVSLCISLTTKQAANIFLNINSKQVQVPRSLIYDLYGEIEDDIDHAINRANDIAHELNDIPTSPYYKMIKFPGNPRGVGIIELATVISAFRPHLESDGIFKRIKLASLDNQKQAILNYFSAIKSYYDSKDQWQYKTKNPFLASAGFNGAVDYLTSTLLTKCAELHSFEVSTLKELLLLDPDALLVHDDIKSLDGKTARKKVAEYLRSHFIDGLPAENEYKF